jgi:hypothetical protein
MVLALEGGHMGDNDDEQSPVTDRFDDLQKDIENLPEGVTIADVLSGEVSIDEKQSTSEDRCSECGRTLDEDPHRLLPDDLRDALAEESDEELSASELLRELRARDEC